jgi:hypothetical protein
MICKAGNIIIVRGYQNKILFAFMITNNLCVINNNVFMFKFYKVMCEFQRTRVEFKLLTDQNFIWDRTIIEIL